MVTSMNSMFMILELGSSKCVFEKVINLKEDIKVDDPAVNGELDTGQFCKGGKKALSMR